MAGRIPHPTAIKQLRGNPGRRPLNDAEPEPKKGEPMKPSQLAGRAIEMWGSTCRVLEEMGLLHTSDGIVIGEFCQAFTRLEEVRKVIEAEGIYYRSGELVKRHPAAADEQKLSMLLLTFARELGLSPASRTRIKMDNMAAYPFEEFLNGCQN